MRPLRSTQHPVFGKFTVKKCSFFSKRCPTLYMTTLGQSFSKESAHSRADSLEMCIVRRLQNESNSGLRFPSAEERPNWWGGLFTN